MSESPENAANQAQPQQEPQQEVKAGTPQAFLKNVVGGPVVVRLNTGVDYHGSLSCLDGYMNIALTDTQEVVNGHKTTYYGDAFVRGNNVLYITKA